MKYTEAWASLAQQNLNLKRVTIAFAILCLCLVLISLRLAFREEFVFERGCFTKAVEKIDSKHSPQEIETFLQEAIKQRFNSDSQPADGYLSQQELTLRNQEQKEFKQRSMTQMILVRSVKESNGLFIVEADRVVAAGKVRSAFRWPLEVTLSSKARSAGNPYGLMVASVVPIEKETK